MFEFSFLISSVPFVATEMLTVQFNQHHISIFNICNGKGGGQKNSHRRQSTLVCVKLIAMLAIITGVFQKCCLKLSVYFQFPTVIHFKFLKHHKHLPWLGA